MLLHNLVIYVFFAALLRHGDTKLRAPDAVLSFRRCGIRTHTHTHTTFRTQIPITFRIFIYGWTQRIVIYLCVLHFDHLLCALRVPSSAWIVYQEAYNLYKPSAHISLIFTLYPRVGSLQDTSARSAEWLARAVTYVHTISSGGMIYDGRWARFGRVDHRCGLIWYTFSTRDKQGKRGHAGETDGSALCGSDDMLKIGFLSHRVCVCVFGVFARSVIEASASAKGRCATQDQ